MRILSIQLHKNLPSLFLQSRLRSRFCVCLGLIICLSGCSSVDEDDSSRTAGFTERQFYEVIERDVRSHNWEQAIQNLQALEAQFPFGVYAEQAQLELIHAYYRSRDYQAAIAAADRFIDLQPQHPQIDYALYIKGLASYSESRSVLGGSLPVDGTKRDPGAARESFDAFNQLLKRYPNSQYAADARKRMIHLRNHLARYEIHVANYYFRRGAYLAAVNRGRFVVENYPKTPAVADALAVLAQGYYLLGQQDLADSTVAVLASNYPQHPAFNNDGQFDFSQDVSGEQRSWLNKLSFGLVDNPRPPGYDSRDQYNSIYKAENRKERNEKQEKRSWLSRLTFGLFD
ncbi:outer membrane protein assembly factor BamD [bacterium SCSIO 12696]|nr:outer membrane protein assembly factor BamD [bacterium SCSIO 12696]